MSRWWKAAAGAGAALVGLVAAVAALVAALNLRDEAPTAVPPLRSTPQQVARGAYLARAGNCAACHTARGGAAYAGGPAVVTPFGVVYASNLTPDAASGLGAWSAGDFWRALHNGRSKGGRLLYPAFPYPDYTQVTREDADALFAYLSTLPAVAQNNRPPALRFPYDTQAALAVWRALFFEPGVYAPVAGATPAWNRGAYLVRGLGHCASCHAGRNVLGATRDAAQLGGGLIPAADWYAPSLASAREAGVAGWPAQAVVDLLKTGVSRHGTVSGPMADVVAGSTQYLSDTDLQAMALYLQSLPQRSVPAPDAKPAGADSLQRGALIYKNECAACHGAQGQGAAGAYPPLAGNRAVVLDTPANLIRIVSSGGFPPSTAGNPRPYGMPPFGHVMNDAQIADVLSYIRQAWGNQAPAVSQLDVARRR